MTDVGKLPTARGVSPNTRYRLLCRAPHNDQQLTVMRESANDC